MSNKPNTCKPSSLYERLKRQLEGIRKHVASNPTDKASLARMNVIEAQLADYL
jgi:ribosomal protein S15P/S13E